MPIGNDIRVATYPGDTAILAQHEPLKDASGLLEGELIRLEDWLNRW